MEQRYIYLREKILSYKLRIYELIACKESRKKLKRTE